MISCSLRIALRASHPSLSLPSRPYGSDPSVLTGPSHRPDRRQIHPRNSHLEA
jgi:hypothetical protein